MNRIVLSIFLIGVFSLNAGEIDFKKAKLEALTKRLQLSEEQQVQMKVIVAEDSLFINEGLSLRPDIENLSAIIENRVERIRLLHERVRMILDEKQLPVYFGMKTELLTNKFANATVIKLSLSDEVTICLYEIVNLTAKATRGMGQDRGVDESMGQPPEGGTGRRGQGMGRQPPPDRKQDARPDNSPVIEIFSNSLINLLTPEQFEVYKNIKKDIQVDIAKEFGQTTTAERRNRGGMKGGPGGMGQGRM